VIGHSLGIGHTSRKVTVEQIGSHQLLVPAIDSAGAMLAHFGTQATLMHELCGPLLPARVTFGLQHCMNVWAAIDLPIGVIDAHNALPQHGILLATAAGCPLEPDVIAAHRNL